MKLGMTQKVTRSRMNRHAKDWRQRRSLLTTYGIGKQSWHLLDGAPHTERTRRHHAAQKGPDHG